MWNETYATDVHFLLSRLPNPTARGDGWAALSLGLAQGTLEGAGPPHRALLPSESKAWPAGCLTSASCPCNGAGTNNGALVQTRFSASEVTLEMLLHQHLGRLILRSTQPSFLHRARLRGPDHHPLPRGWLCLHGEVSSGIRGGTQRLIRVRPEDESRRPGEQSTTARSLPRPLPEKNGRGRSADQTDKRPSQEGADGWQPTPTLFQM